MTFKHNKSGFTLLEVIIVIIIVGVLASLALPRFFRTVEYSRSMEALENLSTIRSSIERCYLPRASYLQCANYNNLDVADPTSNAGSLFVYALGPGAYTGSYFQITARRNTVDGGDNTSTVVFSSSLGDVTRSGTSVFAGVN